MLRNLKVGTKLFVILLAPMIVIVALVAVGVRDRRASSSDAARVEDLSSFALVGGDLISQLQVEQLRSGVYSASRGATGRAELDQQRTLTDAAIARYQAAITKLDPGPRSRIAGRQHRPGQEPPQQHPRRAWRRRQQPQPALHGHRALR